MRVFFLFDLCFFLRDLPDTFTFVVTSYSDAKFSNCEYKSEGTVSTRSSGGCFMPGSSETRECIYISPAGIASDSLLSVLKGFCPPAIAEISASLKIFYPYPFC